MARRKSLSPDALIERIRATSDLPEAIRESAELKRKTRTRRPGLLAEETVNVCFRLERSRALELKASLVKQDIEIGEFFDKLLRQNGF